MTPLRSLIGGLAALGTVFGAGLAFAGYAIIASWDGQNRVTRYNYVETEAEALDIVDRLRNRLSVEDRAPDAYYVEMPPSVIGYEGFDHRARYWIADPANGTVSVDTAKIHSDVSAQATRRVTVDADRRIDEMFSPGDPSRAERVKLQLIARGQELQDKGRQNWTPAERQEWTAAIAFNTRARAIRNDAKALQDSFAEMTARQIMTVDVSDDIHWSE